MSFTQDRELRMIETYQQVFQLWAALAPDECSTTDRDYRFKVKVLPEVEKCSFDNPPRRYYQLPLPRINSQIAIMN